MLEIIRCPGCSLEFVISEDIVTEISFLNCPRCQEEFDPNDVADKEQENAEVMDTSEVDETEEFVVAPSD